MKRRSIITYLENLNPLMLAVAETSQTLLLNFLKSKHTYENVWWRTLPTTLLQMLSYFILSAIEVIVKKVSEIQTTILGELLSINVLNLVFSESCQHSPGPRGHTE